MTTDRVPVTVLTGFLGAGKTTLLNRLLSGDHGRRIAVMVNDFGEINIDAELVVGVEQDVVSLANGCVCCQVRDDLVTSITETVGDSLPLIMMWRLSGAALTPCGEFGIGI